MSMYRLGCVCFFLLAIVFAVLGLPVAHWLSNTAIAVVKAFFTSDLGEMLITLSLRAAAAATALFLGVSLSLPDDEVRKTEDLEPTPGGAAVLVIIVSVIVMMMADAFIRSVYYDEPPYLRTTVAGYVTYALLTVATGYILGRIFHKYLPRKQAPASEEGQELVEEVSEV